MQKWVRGNRKTVIEPLFPNYVFVKFDYKKIAMSAVWNNATIQLSSLPQSGDQVVIHEGIYAGVKAIYTQPDGEMRMILLLDTLNTTVPKSFDNREFN